MLFKSARSFVPALVLFVVAGVLVSALAGRKIGAAGQEVNLPVYDLPMPQPAGSDLNVYGGIAWVGNYLVVSHSALASQYEEKLWQMHPDGTGFKEMPIPPYPGCEKSAFASPTRLPDGRLGYGIRCQRGDPMIPTIYLAAYDFNTGQATPLLDTPIFARDIEGGAFSWNPEMTRGVINDGIDFFYKTRPFTFTRLGAQFLDTHGKGPVVRGSMWSPDGKKIAFLAGGPQVDDLWTLYLMNEDGSDLHVLEGNMEGVTGLAWSPDGRFIAHNNTRVTLTGKEPVLDVVEVPTGEQKTISKLFCSFLAWSPDGRSLAIVREAGGYYDEKNPPYTQLSTMDVNSLPALFKK